MQKNELSVIESTDISRWDFEGIRTALAQMLAEYDTHVYTDKASAKGDGADLNKIKKVMEDKRKEYKNICLAPYNAVEMQIKELVGMIDSQRKKIDDTVGIFEQKRMDEKKADMKKYYDSKSAALGKYAEKIYGRIFDKKWLNVTTTVKKYQEEILIGIEKAKEEMEQLRSLGSPFVDSLIDNYAAGASLEDCIAKNEEILAANSRAGISGQDTDGVQKAASGNNIGSGDVVIKLKGLKNRTYQLNMVLDFLSALGIEFEILSGVTDENSAEE